MLPNNFASKIMPVTESGCWIWMGGIKEKGYGIYSQKTLGLKPVYAHRFAYEKLRGLIPLTKQLDHLCRVRCCVNPDHLEIVTRHENILRGISPAALCARKTHCTKDHLLAGPNLLMDGRHRRCRICRTEYERKRHRVRYKPR